MQAKGHAKYLRDLGYKCTNMTHTHTHTHTQLVLKYNCVHFAYARYVWLCVNVNAINKFCCKHYQLTIILNIPQQWPYHTNTCNTIKHWTLKKETAWNDNWHNSLHLLLWNHCCELIIFLFHELTVIVRRFVEGKRTSWWSKRQLFLYLCSGKWSHKISSFGKEPLLRTSKESLETERKSSSIDNNYDEDKPHPPVVSSIIIFIKFFFRISTSKKMNEFHSRIIITYFKKKKKKINV